MTDNEKMLLETIESQQKIIGMLLQVYPAKNNAIKAKILAEHKSIIRKIQDFRLGVDRSNEV